VLSADDPFSDAGRGLQLAAAWGSEVVSLGAAGHINADSGLGDWPEGIALLRALAQSAGLTLDPSTG
jgi:predicted alpha/beta hydrolase family esterase